MKYVNVIHTSITQRTFRLIGLFYIIRFGKWIVYFNCGNKKVKFKALIAYGVDTLARLNNVVPQICGILFW